MLQQTQVSKVVPYYEKWMERLPGPAAVAEAEEGELLRLWEGLGYYSRVQAVMELGATVCAPRRPACEDCPLNECCRARLNWKSRPN